MAGVKVIVIHAQSCFDNALWHIAIPYRKKCDINCVRNYENSCAYRRVGLVSSMLVVLSHLGPWKE